MNKTMIILKRKQLGNLTKAALIDRILAFPDQKLLNEHTNGVKRDYPLADMATAIKENGYEMTKDIRKTMVKDFASITLPVVKVTGTTFQKFDPKAIAVDGEKKDGTVTEYSTVFILTPVDKEGVKVMARLTEGGNVQIGYLPSKFNKKHPVTKDTPVAARMTDYSNGKFKNMSYSMCIDLENLA